MVKKNESLWTKEGRAYQDYFMSQYRTPKESTIKFERFIRDGVYSSNKVLDIGGGNGSSCHFIADKHRQCSFTCADISGSLLKAGEDICRTRGTQNLTFEKIDWFDIPLQRDKYDGVISLQTMSWLPEFERPLEEVFVKIRPKWIGISSLFYDGDISTRCKVLLHSLDEEYYYNTYSLPAVERLSRQFGYKLSRVEDFVLDIELEKPKDRNLMGTYTRCVLNKEKNQYESIQISGPVLLNWKFIYLECQ